MSLSSSFPHHKICPSQTALTCATAVINQKMTSRIVSALQIPLMPGLWNAEPSWIAANVSPAFGKTNAHQFSVNVIRLLSAMTEIVEMQKNQNEKRRTNVPEMIPRILTTSPSAKDPSTLNACSGSTLGACVPSEIRAAAV